MALDPGDLADDATPTGDTAPPTDQQSRQLPPLTPETLHAELQRTRSEAAKYRTQNRDLRKLLSTVSGEEVPEGRPAPDVATLQQRFASLNSGDKATIRELKVRNGLLAVSHKRGIEADYLEFALGKAGQLSDLDVDAEDFGEALDERVAEFLVSRPEVRGQQSGPPPPSQGTGAQIRHLVQPRVALTRESLAAMSPQEISDALAAGSLNALLGRKGGA